MKVTSPPKYSVELRVFFYQRFRAYTKGKVLARLPFIPNSLFMYTRGWKLIFVLGHFDQGRVKMAEKHEFQL